MNARLDEALERRRAALSLVSAAGVLLIGAAIGLILPAAAQSLAWLLLVAGLLVHLYAMVATHRLLARADYVPSPWERASYWLCWAIVTALLLYAATRIWQ